MMPTINTKAVRSLLCVAMIATVLALLVPGMANAQFTRQWGNTWNNSPSRDTWVNIGRNVAFDSAGNVYGVAYSYDNFGSSSNADYTVVKYAPDGSQVWVRHWNGGYSSQYDYAQAIAVDSNDNIWVTGYAYGPNSNYDCTTVAWNSAGVLLLADFVNGTDNGYDYCRHIEADGSGNVYVHGYGDYGNGSYDFMTVKYTAAGRQWVRNHDFANNSEYAYNGDLIGIDGSGNVYVGGHAYVSGNYYDHAVVSYDPAGNLRFASTHNGPDDYYDYMYGLAVDPAGNSYTTGYGYGNYGNYDYMTVSFDSSGNYRWASYYHNYSYDYGRSVAYAGGRVFVTGYSYGSGTYYDVATLAYDAANGSQLWLNRWGSPGTVYDYGYMLDADDLGVYVTGMTYPNGYSAPRSEIYMRAYTPTGTPQNTFLEGGSQLYYDYGYGIQADGSGCVAVGARTTENDAGYSYEYRMGTYLYCQEVGCSVLTARTGGPYTVECNGQPTSFQMDGSFSCDPNDLPLTYSWSTTCPGGTFDDASSDKPNFIMQNPPPCPIVCDVTLTVSNGTDNASDTDPVTNEDTTSCTQPNLPDYNQWFECDNLPTPVAPPAEDICDPDPDEWVTRDKGQGYCPGNYPLTDTYTCVDDCGNSDTQIRQTTVVDTTGPVVTSNDPTYCLWSPNHEYYCFEPAEMPFDATDNCSYPLTTKFTSCSCNQPEDGNGDGNTENDCLVDGDFVCIRSERAGGIAFGRDCQVAVTVWDSCGNASAETNVGSVYIPHDSEDGATKGCLNPKDSPTP